MAVIAGATIFLFSSGLSRNNTLLQARFACLRCGAGGYFVSAGGAFWAPGVTLINYKGDNIPKCACPTVIIDIARKITKFVNFKIFDA